MKKTNIFFLVGLILVVAGAAALLYGIIQFNNVRGAVGNVLAKAITGRSESENQAVIEMIVGAAAALVGIVLLLMPRRSRRR